MRISHGIQEIAIATQLDSRAVAVGSIPTRVECLKQIVNFHISAI